MWSGLIKARRGAVAIWIAAMVPGLLIATSMGVEVASWAAAQVSMQRSVDLAAIAGTQLLAVNSSANPQTVGTFAARIAQMNGGTGTASLSWSGSCNASCSSKCTETGTDNQITVQLIYCGGLQKTSDPMLTVSWTKSVPSYMSSPLFNSSSTHTITMSGSAEVVTQTTPPTGVGAGQPCLVALSSSGAGISGSGSTYITMPGCTIRSNSTITFTGSGTLNTAGIFAGGAVSIPNWFTVTPSSPGYLGYPNDGTIVDPYVSNTKLQTALTNAAGLSGVTSISCNNETCTGLSNGSTCSGSSGVTCTLQPGHYGALTVGGGGPFTFNFQPGGYLFQGAVSMVSATTTINGTGGVTIIAAGGFEFENQPTVNVTAPTAAQATGADAVAGIALASQTTTTVTLSGSAGYNVIGVSYFPNAQFNASGSSGSSGTPAEGSSSSICTEIIASSIVLSGYSNFAGSCGSYGATSFTSTSGTSTTSAQVVH